MSQKSEREEYCITCSPWKLRVSIPAGVYIICRLLVSNPWWETSPLLTMPPAEYISGHLWEAVSGPFFSPLPRYLLYFLLLHLPSPPRGYLNISATSPFCTLVIHVIPCGSARHGFLFLTEPFPRGHIDGCERFGPVG